MKIYKYLFVTLSLGASFVNAENIACVGNSITYGYGLPYGTSYPNDLQQLLGDDYTVSNFGVSGMTFAKEGNQSYWSQSAFSNAYDSRPNKVVIELGTNDSKFFFSNNAELGIYNYNYGVVGVEALKQDYRSLIDTFAHLESKPEIWTTLQPYSNNISWTITDTAIVNVINPIIFDAAVEKGVNIIDLHTLFCTPSWYLNDSVHPNENGAMELAKIIFDHIAMTKPILSYNGSQLTVEGGYSYYWYKDGILINDANTQSLEVSEAGDYKALVKVKSSDNSYLVSNTVSLNEDDLTQVAETSMDADQFVYSNGMLFVPKHFQNSQIEVLVYDVAGRLIGKIENPVNISLPRGGHMLLVEVDGRVKQTIKVKE